MASSSPLKLGPSSKRQRLSTDLSKCTICQQVTKEKLSGAQKSGRKTLLITAEQRKDDVLERLRSYGIGSDSEECNIAGPSSTLSEISILYHRSCYARYTSKTNLLYARVEESPRETISKESGFSTRATRTATASFDKNVCIVCLKKTHKGDRKLFNFAAQNREEQLRHSAKVRNDGDMLCRLGPADGPDLVAQEAVYHKPCLSSYVSKTNLATQSWPSENPNEEKDHDNAFRLLISEIQDDLMKDCKAFQLSTLLEKYKQHLPETINKDTYRIEKLEKRFVKYYGDKIVIQKEYGQGKSSLIFSSKITLTDAIKSISKLSQRLKDTQSEQHIEMLTDDSDKEKNVYSSLHRAIGMLREAIQAIPNTNEYPGSNEVSLHSSEKFVPKPLAVAMKWLLSTNAFNSADPDYHTSDNIKRKYLSLAECVIFCGRKVATPLHHGLAVQLHHEYGKRAIIDTLNSHGFCISYDELRTFITSVAVEQMDKDTDVYIPPEIVPIASGGALIHEGDDNIDINPETIDGKNTFHSMARVIFQQQNETMPAPEIPRVKRGDKKSLPLGEAGSALTECRPFKKPTQRPEPPKIDNPLEKLKSCKVQVSLCFKMK